MSKGSAVRGSNRMMYGLIYLAMIMSLGHHIDHVIQGNHVGWPLTAEVNAFTYSLGIYPLIILGLYHYASGRWGRAIGLCFRARELPLWLGSTSVPLPQSEANDMHNCLPPRSGNA